MTVYFPHPAGEALNLTLTTTDDTDALLWDAPNPGADAQLGAPDMPVLGNGVSSYSFSAGPYDSTTKTFWVGATAGSTIYDALRYSISGEADDANSAEEFEDDKVAGRFAATGVDAPVAPGESSGSDGDCQNGGNLLKEWITLNDDPNPQDHGDGSAGNPYNFLIGQKVKLVGHVKAPPEILGEVSYVWQVPGPIYGKYDPTSESAKPVPVAGRSGIKIPAPGDHEVFMLLNFFWSATADAPVAHHTISLELRNGAPTPYLEADVHIDVYTPTATTAAPRVGAVGIYEHPAGPLSGTTQLGLYGLPYDPPPSAKIQQHVDAGIIFSGAVTTPTVGGAQMFAGGLWKFVQIINDHSTEVMNGVTTFKETYHDKWVLDSATEDIAINARYGYVTPLISRENATGWPTDDSNTYLNFDDPSQTLHRPASADNVITSKADFETTIMYRPPDPSSSWVPLMYLGWSYSISAHQQSLGWRVTPKTMKDPDAAGPLHFIRAFGLEPRWSGHI